MAKVSILMSVYNETEFMFRQSLESLINQTFSDFELIIIDDNPNRTDVKEIIDSYHDSRFFYHKNVQNVGLAISMNKAAELASTSIYARMDADDISEPNRLMRELEIIDTGDYDFVFTNYNKIDLISNIIQESVLPPIPEEEINEYIALHPSIIHHPTVMYTKAIFEKAGKYRDFPCAQDNDLWLRMTEKKCRFYMINSSLLNYRINPNSVTSRRWFRQQLTCYYIFDLSIERLVKGNDSFSKENYESFLLHWGRNAGKEKRFKKAQDLLEKSQHSSKIFSILCRISAFFTSDIVRHYYINLKRKEKLLNRSIY